MTLEEMLDHALAMFQRRGRVTYRARQRQFNMDDVALGCSVSVPPMAGRTWPWAEG